MGYKIGKKNKLRIKNLYTLLSWVCCQVASVVSDFVRPHRQQPTRLPRPWDSPGKNTGVGCHFLLQCVKSESEVAQSVRLLATPWTAANQAPPSMEFSRQEYWSGVLHLLTLYNVKFKMIFFFFKLHHLLVAHQKSSTISFSSPELRL